MTGTSGGGPSKLARRMPLMAPALIALLAGLWSGLLRLGLDLPDLRTDFAGLHGPLMVLGFLGTQVGLERAVALGRGWTYLVPAAAGAGSLALILGLPPEIGQTLLAVGGLLLIAVSVAIHRLQPAWHNTVMGLGAVAWAIGAIAWLFDAALVDVVPWLAAFLVLTIVGERIELSRMVNPPESARRQMLAAVAVFIGGLVVAVWSADVGLRIAGGGLLAQTLWLLRYDVARRTIRMGGATRYMATAMLAGYFWLTVASVTLIVNGALSGYGFGYDAVLHAIFLGFVFSMIFAHAPVIVPAILGVKLPYRPVFYLPLALLHASLAARLVADAVGATEVWRVAGAVNEVAILLFLVLAVTSAIRARGASAPQARAAS